MNAHFAEIVSNVLIVVHYSDTNFRVVRKIDSIRSACIRAYAGASLSKTVLISFVRRAEHQGIDRLGILLFRVPPPIAAMMLNFRENDDGSRS